MSAEVTIPRLGWSMEEGIFVRWLKQPGEWVAKGEQLFLLESEKATQEIESLDEGILHLPSSAPQPGATVLVGQVIALLLARGETPPSSDHAPQASPAQSVEPSAPTAPSESSSAPVAGPAARRLARQLNVGLGAVAGSGRGGRITTGDVHAAAGAQTVKPGNGAAHVSPCGVPRDVVAVTPRARRAARELGVDAAGLAGSGRGGRVRERDVLAAAESLASRAASGGGQTMRPAASSTIRRTIARRMVASHQATAPVTLSTRVDATNLVNLRNQFKAAAGQEIVPSLTDLVVKLLSIALVEHPWLNARWENDAVVEIAEIHVGIAVDTPTGLLVPVLRDVPALGVRDIARRSRELIEAARTGTLSTAELTGGTFTVTNLGMYGIDAFTPIINPPEAAILGLGAVRREPVYVGEQVVPREMMTLSLTFDHRIVDGAPAARFLQTLSTGIENPAAWLLG